MEQIFEIFGISYRFLLSLSLSFLSTCFASFLPHIISRKSISLKSLVCMHELLQVEVFINICEQQVLLPHPSSIDSLIKLAGNSAHLFCPSIWEWEFSPHYLPHQSLG